VAGPVVFLLCMFLLSGPLGSRWKGALASGTLPGLCFEHAVPRNPPRRLQLSSRGQQLLAKGVQIVRLQPNLGRVSNVSATPAIRCGLVQ